MPSSVDTAGSRTSCLRSIRSTLLKLSGLAACLLSAARASPPSSSNITMATCSGVTCWWSCSCASSWAAVSSSPTLAVNFDASIVLAGKGV